jgi:AcrR family transcriptional regulator
MTSAPEIKADTKTRILDAAEKLFSNKGFDATSLRDITAEAQVNLAAVNYHFQSKDALIDAVIDRRIRPVNDRRLAMLEAAGPAPSVQQIIEAFLMPTFEADLEAVLPLMGRFLANPEQFVDRMLKKKMHGVVEKFVQALGLALPHLSPTELFWRFHFLAGMMSHVLLFSRVLPIATNGLCDLSDRPAVARRMIAFAVEGFKAAATEVQGDA